MLINSYKELQILLLLLMFMYLWVFFLRINVVTFLVREIKCNIIVVCHDCFKSLDIVIMI